MTYPLSLVDVSTSPWDCVSDWW